MKNKMKYIGSFALIAIILTVFGCTQTAAFAGTTNTSTSTAENTAEYQVIHMDVTGAGYSPNSFVLKTGVPVKWIINGIKLNGCNSGIIVPEYKLNFKLKTGEQTIEFTPTKSGTIQWSCWMGMIQGTFIVKDDAQISTN
ncbi:MAG: cupredoxin domain-containing protein [archaeon]